MDGVNRETFIGNIGFRYQKCGSTAPATRASDKNCESWVPTRFRVSVLIIPDRSRLLHHCWLWEKRGPKLWFSQAEALVSPLCHDGPEAPRFPHKSHR